MILLVRTSIDRAFDLGFALLLGPHSSWSLLGYHCSFADPRHGKVLVISCTHRTQYLEKHLVWTSTSKECTLMKRACKLDHDNHDVVFHSVLSRHGHGRLVAAALALTNQGSKARAASPSPQSCITFVVCTISHGYRPRILLNYTIPDLVRLIALRGGGDSRPMDRTCQPLLRTSC